MLLHICATGLQKVMANGLGQLQTFLQDSHLQNLTRSEFSWKQTGLDGVCQQCPWLSEHSQDRSCTAHSNSVVHSDPFDSFSTVLAAQAVRTHSHSCSVYLLVNPVQMVQHHYICFIKFYKQHCKVRVKILANSRASQACLSTNICRL